MSKIPHITFYIDFEEDLSYVLRRITKFDPAGIAYRIKSRELDSDVVYKILEESDQTKQREIFGAYLQKVYTENKEGMNHVQKTYQVFWDEHAELFFSIATTIMGGFQWKWDEYRFLVSAFYSRASWGKGNTLGVLWKREPAKHFHMNGYELVLTHYFEIVDELYNKRPVSDWHMWALAEMTAGIITRTDERIVNALWPEINYPNPLTLYESGSYPMLNEPYQKIYPLYQNLTNFDDFVKKSIDIISTYSEKDLTQTV